MPTEPHDSEHSSFSQSLLTGCGEDLSVNICCKATTLPLHLLVLYRTPAALPRLADEGEFVHPL